MADARSPTVRHKRLMAELLRLRQDAGMSRDDVGGRLDWSPQKIWRIETGRSRAHPSDVRLLLDLYGVADEGQREALVQLARDSRQRGWWHSYGDVLPSEYAAFIDLEAGAESIRWYEQVLVPGLLQTEEYARAVIHAFRPGDTEEELERRVAVRMQRQRRLAELRLSVVLGEGVLRQLVGDPKTTADQLRGLAANRRTNVMVQVLPYAAGGHPALTGSFAILTFADPLDPDVVYLENMASALFLEEDEEIRAYAATFEYLQATALGPNDSRAMLMAAAAEFEAMRGGAG